MECCVRSFFLVSPDGRQLQAQFRVTNTELSAELHGWMSDLLAEEPPLE